MRFGIIVLFLSTFFSLSAQIGTGQWRMHVAAKKAIDIAVGNNLVMAALETGVVEYDIEAKESKIFNNLNGLSEIDVSCIGFDPSTRSFFVGYKNGNIDQITSSGSIINIPGIKLAQFNGDKNIYELNANNGKIYAATGFSIVVIDPNKHEIKDTYYPTSGSEAITDLFIKGDSLFGLTKNTLYKGYLANQLLADPTQWQIDSRVSTPVGGLYYKADVLNNEIYLLYKKDGYGADSVFHVTNGGLDMVIGSNFSMEILDFDAKQNTLQVIYENACVQFNVDGTVYSGIEKYGTQISNPSAVEFYQNYYWIADHSNGLVRYTHQNSFEYINREGPPKNSAFSVNGDKGKTIVTTGRLDRVVFSYLSEGAYSMEDENWNLYDNSNQTNWQGKLVWDISTAAVNPKNIDEFALGCYCMDPLSIVSGSQVTQVYNSSNSGLELTTLGNNNTCISALEYDEDGNLWVANCYSNKPIKVKATDGNWYSFETGTDSKAVFTSKLLIDYNDYKWLGLYGRGLVALNDNGTLSNTADDVYVQLKTGVGQGNLPSDNVTALAVDFDNEIWIGTEDGFVVLYNSEGIFNSNNIDASRILVNFEGNVEVLLDDTPIVDIEIDGGNRKWIATAATGVFLLSADGQEVISHFTKENSPLISNNILDMEFNHQTGELFIVTDVGLVSYRSDASYGDEDYSSTTVFPNPVKPDFFGPITIQGIRSESDVKITDVAGNLVFKTTSNGGTATWNGKTLTGENAAGGVYLIWTATNEKQEGKDKKVGKVVVIR